MAQKITILLLFLFLCITCKEPVDPPAERDICLTVKHHEAIFSNSSVYIKFNTDFFPGYQDLTIFDEEIRTNEEGRGCFLNVPEGRHWLVCKGYDEAQDEDVKGSIRVEMQGLRYYLDTIIYVGH